MTIPRFDKDRILGPCWIGGPVTEPVIEEMKAAGCNAARVMIPRQFWTGRKTVTGSAFRQWLKGRELWSIMVSTRLPRFNLFDSLQALRGAGFRLMVTIDSSINDPMNYHRGTFRYQKDPEAGQSFAVAALTELVDAGVLIRGDLVEIENEPQYRTFADGVFTPWLAGILSATEAIRKAGRLKTIAELEPGSAVAPSAVNVVAYHALSADQHAARRFALKRYAARLACNEVGLGAVPNAGRLVQAITEHMIALDALRFKWFLPFTLWTSEDVGYPWSPGRQIAEWSIVRDALRSWGTVA